VSYIHYYNKGVVDKENHTGGNKMYFKSLKNVLINEDNKKSNAEGKLNLLVKKLRQRNSVYFAVDTTGRTAEISRAFLTA